MDTSFDLNSSQPTFEMKNHTISELYTMQKEVRFSIGVLSTHGVSFAARWSSELLISINKQIRNLKQTESENKQLENKNNINASDISKYKSYKSSINSLCDECILAKTYFDLRDYNRVIETLKNIPNLNANNYAFFLLCYSLYLIGEKTKEEEILESNNQLEKSQIINKNLTEIMSKINRRENEIINSKLNGFHYYIKGICLRELNRDSESIESLIKSVNIFPYNWSCLRSLAELIINEKIFIYVKSKLLNHWIVSIFIAEVMVETVEFYNPIEIIKYCNNLTHKLPQNTHILGQQALIYYNLHKYDECINIFQEILSIDPFRIELLDVYSNILYVKEKRKELSYLAHRCMELNKYRPETCCIVGNYYGMYGMHEKAILYFERSLALNSNFISSYVLMGHEYIEMRNETAAIECYRKSIDLNCNDYRGWYGLGQTYELLQMYTYSIFYYNKVCKLRPYDYRMWMALGSCYKNLSNIKMSIKSYERAQQIAISNNTITNEYKLIIFQLAKLYNLINQINKSKKKYLKYISFINSKNKILNDNEIEALIKLSEIELNNGKLSNAKKYAQRIVKYGQKGKDTANKILNQINNQTNSNNNNNNNNNNNDDGDDGDDMEISYID